MDDKQLSIFEEEQPKMTVKNIAVALSVSESTILRYIKKTMPEKIINGMTTLLNETEVTRMKLKLQQNQHLVRPEELPKTELEENLIIQQAQNLLLTRIDKLKNQLEQAQPAIDFHEKVGDSSGLLPLSEVSKALGTGRTRFCNWLRGEGIFQKGKAIPYQRYEEQGYFKVKVTTVNGHIQKQTFITGKGMIWLEKLFAKE